VALASAEFGDDGVVADVGVGGGIVGMYAAAMYAPCLLGVGEMSAKQAACGVIQASA